jgi:hypothetical protein
MWLASVTVTCAWYGAHSQEIQNGFGAYTPPPKAELMTETVHGVNVSDPYRWMEKTERRDEMWIAVRTLSCLLCAATPSRVRSSLRGAEIPQRLQRKGPRFSDD